MASNVRFLDQVPVSAYGNTTALTINTGSFMVTGSASGSTLTFTKGDGTTFNLLVSGSGGGGTDVIANPGGTGSALTTIQIGSDIFVITGSGGSADLLQQLVSNQTVGAISPGSTFTAGSSIEDLLRTMLITDISSTISSLNVKNGSSIITLGTLEVNTALTFDTTSFSATADSPDGNFPVTSSFAASGATTGNFTFSLGNGPVVASNNLDLGGTRTLETPTLGVSDQSSTTTLTLTSKNPKDDATLTTSRTATFVYPLYYGNSITDFSTSGNVEGTLTKSVQTRPSQKSVLLNFSGEFIYFCYPASYPDLTSILDGNGFETLSAFTKYTRTQDGASAGWSGRSYKIYKSGTTSVPNQTFVFKF
tara:strand:- start:467 stop:1558 length:1092 start_codon:yes stop_codon:yes gene_type:complete